MSPNCCRMEVYFIDVAWGNLRRLPWIEEGRASEEGMRGRRGMEIGKNEGRKGEGRRRDVEG